MIQAPNASRAMMEALDKATRYRMQRGALHRSVKAKETKVSDVLEEECPEWLEGEPIGRLLRWVPGVGAKTMRRILNEIDIRELKKVGTLTERQRERLVGALRERGW